MTVNWETLHSQVRSAYLPGPRSRFRSWWTKRRSNRWSDQSALLIADAACKRHDVGECVRRYTYTRAKVSACRIGCVQLSARGGIAAFAARFDRGNTANFSSSRAYRDRGFFGTLRFTSVTLGSLLPHTSGGVTPRKYIRRWWQ